MARKRKVKRTIFSAVLLWIGRLLLHRVQKRTLRAVSRAPRPAAARSWRRRPAAPVVPEKRRPRVPPRVAKGAGIAILSAAAAAAMKVGVERVIEAERQQPLVTPDFDVFSDDEE